MPRIIDPDRLILLARTVDWEAVRSRHKHETPAAFHARMRQISTRVVQLRWLVHPGIGYPTEPFKVWRRQSVPIEGEELLEPSVTATPFGWSLISWGQPALSLRARFQAFGNAMIVAYAGAPLTSAIVGFENINAGMHNLKFSGPAISCLAVIGSASLQELIGVRHGPADDPSWELVELVGLPVDRNQWSGVHQLDQPQGLVNNLMEPVDAALDRYRRGAPLYGWETTVEPGFVAPQWDLADPVAILKTVDQSMLGGLRDMVTSLAPNQHAGFTEHHALDLVGGGPKAETSYRPMNTLLFAAGTDPLASLITGFGTAYDNEDLPAIHFGAMSFFGDPKHADFDFMVTAMYENGLDGNSDPVEYAAIVWGANNANDPPRPSNLTMSTDGHHAPSSTDGAWRGVIRAAWDKVPDQMPFRIGSYAFVRKPTSPAGPTTPLMGERPNDVALQPISATTSADEETNFGVLRALDETYAISATPAVNTLRYGLAHQDLFGMWSPWSAAGHSISEPAVQTVSIITSRLDTSAPAGGGSICPATLVVDVAWDWGSRSLLNIDLVGKLYAQAKRNQPPANMSIPNGLQKLFPGPIGPHFFLTFNGGNAGTPGPNGSVSYVTQDGKNVQATPIVVNGMRRYRLTITGFQLDFAGTGHVGLALWARGRENKAPQRTGPWPVAAIASASDPRPPIIQLEHENVLLASMADAAGEHHARLTWPSVSGATGYFIYTSTETKIRVDNDMSDALPGQTLSQRLADLRDAFAANPQRRSFTRINDTPITTTSAQVTLPRGSKEIHFYLVIGISAGQVESPWPAIGDPNLRKRPVAYAAPQIAAPSRPVLEVSRVLDDSVTPAVYRAALRINTRPGAVVSRIDVFRTRVHEASLAADTMGPPIAGVESATPPWIVTPTTGTGPGESQPIGLVRGTDSPAGSWKRVYYRAVAWSDDQPEKGLYAGRSPDSAAQSVIIPPPGPPNLSAVVSSWPGGPLADILLTVTTTEPVEPTPLGPHRIKVEVMALGDDDTLAPLFVYPQPDANGKVEDRLIAVPSIQPVPPSGGIWRQAGPGANTTSLKVLVKRASFTQALRGRILITDPLGRSTEQTFSVPGTSPFPEPVFVSPVVTKVPGKGFRFSFETALPISPTPHGPYLLRAGWAPGVPFLQTTITPGRLGSVLALDPAGVEVPLNQIPLLRPPDDPFTDSTPIPMRRSRGSGLNALFAVYLRGVSGRLSLELVSPDGRSTRIQRTLR